MTPRATAWLVLSVGAALLLGARFLARRGGALYASMPQGPVVSLGAHDFGTLIGARTEESELHALNPGPETWHVVDTSQDCGCVQVISASEKVEPGESLVVRFRIHTAGQPLGPLQKHVFATVEPNHVRFAGLVSAYTLPAPYAEPSAIEVEVPRGAPRFAATTRVRVPLLGANPGLVIDDPPPGVRVEIGGAVKAGELAEFPVSLTGELRKDRQVLSETVRLRVSGMDGLLEQTEVAIVIVARRQQEVRVSPRVLYLDARAPASARGRLFVTAADGKPPAQLRWREEPSGLLRIVWDAELGVLTVEAEASALASMPAVQLTLLAGDAELAAIPIRFSSGSPAAQR